MGKIKRLIIRCASPFREYRTLKRQNKILELELLTLQQAQATIDTLCKEIDVKSKLNCII